MVVSNMYRSTCPRAICAILRLPTTALQLEITESLLLSDFDQAEERLLRLRGLGIRIALDDFGTGYSSLAYIRRLPLDVIKIDRSFSKDVSVAAALARHCFPAAPIARDMK